MKPTTTFRMAAAVGFASGLFAILSPALRAEEMEPITFEVTDAAALTSGFTLQGKLSDGGVPVNGLYDFQFKLFDASVAGIQLGSTVLVNDHAVSTGLFTTELNFGNGLFGGDLRWVEIGVRPGASVAAHTLLSPRTQVGSSAQSLSLPNVFTDPGNNFVGIGRNFRISGNEMFGMRYVGNPDQYGGMYVETSDPNGWPFYGYARNGSFQAWTYLGNVPTHDSAYWALYYAGIRLKVPVTGGLRIGPSLNYSLVIENTTGSDGIRILDTGDDGIQIGSNPDIPNYGVYIPSPGVSTYGLWSNTSNVSGQWALYSVDNIQAGNVVASAYSIVGRVAGGPALLAGDVVAVSSAGDAIPGSGYPLANVRAAEATLFTGVVGVVESRMAYESAPGKEAEGEKSMRSVPGAAGDGDYVSLIVYGVARVNVDPASEIAAGQRLTASSQPGRVRALQTVSVSGVTVAESAPTIGTALEASTPGKETIPVFVTLK